MTLPPGYRHRRFAEIGSTNQAAAEAGQAGEPELLVITAGVQTAGRGRRGRDWVSPVGNLYSSVLLRPDVSPAVGAQLSFVAALAVSDLVAEAIPGAPVVACKWPNDVLVNGAKIAGILLESQTDAAGHLAWLVIGAGINVVSHPPNTAYAATSLAACGASVAAEDCLALYLARLDHWRQVWMGQGFAPVRAAWLARAWRLGEVITARLGEKSLGGIFEGLDDAGALLLAGHDGRRHVIAAGEVFAPA